MIKQSWIIQRKIEQDCASRFINNITFNVSTNCADKISYFYFGYNTSVLQWDFSVFVSSLFSGQKKIKCIYMFDSFIYF